MKKAILIICAAFLLLGACKSSGSKKADKTDRRSKIENTKASKSKDNNKKTDSRAEKIEQARKEMRELKKEYDALFLQMTRTPDPMERSKISDKMESIDRKAENLSKYLMQETGFPY